MCMCVCVYLFLYNVNLMNTEDVYSDTIILHREHMLFPQVKLIIRQLSHVNIASPLTNI